MIKLTDRETSISYWVHPTSIRVISGTSSNAQYMGKYSNVLLETGQSLMCGQKPEEIVAQIEEQTCLKP